MDAQDMVEEDMATALLVPVEEYLSSSYEPDMDYEDGVLIERNLGKRTHSRLQTELTYYIRSREKAWGIEVLVEQRIRVAPTRFCVADICARRLDSPVEEILTHPPLFTIEIVSDGDRFADIEAKAQKYVSMGIGNVWTVDPATGLCWSHDAQHSMTAIPGGVLRIPDSPVAIPVTELVKSI